MSENTPVPTAPRDLQVTWHALSREQVLEKLDSGLEKGLSSEKAKARVAEYGLNQLEEGKKTTFLQMVIAQLNSFVVILLIVAAAISALLGETIDAIAIVTIVILNTVMGVVQEGKAQQELAALKKMASPEAQVLRDGHRVSVPARDLVPGDIVFLETGNFVPADVRLLEAVNLKIEEAALTGESVPVEKNAALRPRFRRLAGRPAQHRLQRHRGHLRARIRRGRQHRHAHPARPDRQDAPVR